MQRSLTIGLCLTSLLLFASCSPRDFLTRRLAADLIGASDVFKTPQPVTLHTGIISSKDYLAPEYSILQHRGWINATGATCPPQFVPPPCWDVVLTPSGVDTIRALMSAADIDQPAFSVPAAKRELVEITGISKQGNVADVEFTWRWVPLNEVGAAFYSTDQHYTSTVVFRSYDDGWRVVQGAPHAGQTIDDALKNAEPAQ